MITFTSSATPSMTAYSVSADLGIYAVTIIGWITGHTTINGSISFHFEVLDPDSYYCSITVISPLAIADIYLTYTGVGT
jgi:hypothetical protein